MTTDVKDEYFGKSVEPRTIPEKGSDHPGLKYLNSHVVIPIASKWHDIGLELMDVGDEDKLKAIKVEPSLKDDTERAKNMFQKWLDMKPHASWNDLIAVLRAPHIGLCTLAYEIKGKLISEAGSQRQHGYGPTFLDCDSTSTLTINRSEAFLLERNSDQSHNPEDDAKEEHVIGFPKKSKTVIERFLPENMESCDTTTSHTKLCSTDSATSTLQADDNVTNKTKQIRSKSICNVVSEYYNGLFVSQWGKTENFKPISSLAALVLERDGEMTVVVLTTGTAKKTVCSYFLNNRSADECMWDHCDGHAVAVCFRFAIFYLISEMYRHTKNDQISILKMDRGGYELKEGIKLHLFSTKVPCGFMAAEDCPLLSWKVPFKDKPHCLKCSSIILINAYLGIQGPLSHLFTNPVYISSITIPKCENGTESKIAKKVEGHFENLNKRLLKITGGPVDSDYTLNIPDVVIADVDSRELFEECFDPCKDELCLGMQIKPENEIAQTPATLLNSNIGIVCTSKHKLGTDKFRAKMASQLEKASNVAKRKTKVLKSQMESLTEAQLHLSKALNPSEALMKLKISLTEEMNKKLLSSDDKMRQSRPTIDEVTKWKKSFCNIIERYEKDPNIQTMKESLPLLKQKFESCSRLVTESLEEFETVAKSTEDILTTHCRDYQETLDVLKNLLKQSSSTSCDPQLYLDLMGCDWARHLGAMENDVKRGNFGLVNQSPSSPCMVEKKNPQQHLFNRNENLAFDQESSNTVIANQQPHKEKEKSKEGNCDSAHQTSNIPSSAPLPGDRDQQQKCNTNDHDNIDTDIKSQETENEGNLNIIDNDEQGAQTEAAKSQQKKLCHHDAHYYHDESQQQHSDHDNNSNDEPEVKYKPVIDVEQESQNTEAAQEESQLKTVEPKDEVLPCSSPVGSITGSIPASLQSDLQNFNADLQVSLEHRIFAVEPTMHYLNKHVVPKVSSEWEDMAYALSYSVSTVQHIRSKHNGDAKKCCKKVFEDWLTTSNGDAPKTWKTLLDWLIEVEGLVSVTEEIKEELIKMSSQH